MTTHTLSQRGRSALNGLYRYIGQANGTNDVSKMFNLAPSVEQRLESKIRDSVEFLSRVNILPVSGTSGQVIGLGTHDLIASRISRANLPRRPTNHKKMDSRKYELATTLFDSALEWELIDAWSKFKNFPDLYAEHVARSVGLSRICAGFNGVMVAEDTNIETYPLLEDVNIGWLQKMRLERPDHVMGREIVTVGVGAAAVSTATGVPDPIIIGGAQTHKNLDAVAYDLRSQMPVHARNAPGMAVIVSSDLLDDKYMTEINRPLSGTIDGTKSTSDQVVSDVVNGGRQLGGLPAMIAPYFPDGTMLITPLASAPGKNDSNLSIYYQEGSRRRFIKDEPENMATQVDYNSVNEGYVIENTDRCALAENIEYAA